MQMVKMVDFGEKNPFSRLIVYVQCSIRHASNYIQFIYYALGA